MCRHLGVPELGHFLCGVAAVGCMMGPEGDQSLPTSGACLGSSAPTSCLAFTEKAPKPGSLDHGVLPQPIPLGSRTTPSAPNAQWPWWYPLWWVRLGRACEPRLWEPLTLVHTQAQQPLTPEQWSLG